MDQSTNDIRQDIDTIRDSMTDKLEAIETKIKGTVDDTTTNIKQTFDAKHQIRQHPWVAFGAAVAAGYLLAGGRDHDTYHYDAPYRAAYTGNGNSSSSTTMSTSNSPGLFDQLGDSVGGELQMLKGMAVSALVGLITDTVKRNIPAFKDALARAANSNTTTTTGSPYRADSYASPAPTPAQAAYRQPVYTTTPTTTSDR